MRTRSYFIGAILSLFTMSFYWWWAIQYVTGIYIPVIVWTLTASIFLLFSSTIQWKKRQLPVLLILISLIGYVVVQHVIVDYGIRNILFNARLLGWMLVSIFLFSALSAPLDTRLAVKTFLKIWSVIIGITLFIYFLFGEDTLFVLDALAADGDSNVNVVKDIKSGELLRRFVVPGFNSNTVAILSALALSFIFGVIDRYSLKVVVSGIMLTAGFLTFSRMFFVYLAVVIIMWSLIHRSPRLIILTFLSTPVLIFAQPVIYYRFLNTLDGLFGSEYSNGLTESSSDRAALINDSYQWCYSHPFGGSIDFMDKFYPGAAGEHLLPLLLANVNGIFFGVFFLFYMILSFFLAWKSGKRLPASLKVGHRAANIILLLSCFVAPSYYIQLIFWPMLIEWDE